MLLLMTQTFRIVCLKNQVNKVESNSLQLLTLINFSLVKNTKPSPVIECWSQQVFLPPFIFLKASEDMVILKAVDVSSQQVWVCDSCCCITADHNKPGLASQDNIADHCISHILICLLYIELAAWVCIGDWFELNMTVVLRYLVGYNE